MRLGADLYESHSRFRSGFDSFVLSLRQSENNEYDEFLNSFALAISSMSSDNALSLLIFDDEKYGRADKRLLDYGSFKRPFRHELLVNEDETVRAFYDTYLKEESTAKKDFIKNILSESYEYRRKLIK